MIARLDLVPPIEEINEWIDQGRKDPTKRKVVAEGMEQIIAFLRSLGVEPAKKSAI